MIVAINNLKINKTIVIFIIVVLLAILLRLYNLSLVPPSASLDEASIGYNAYSILKTGADEYGTKFPFLIRAYDDWRPALYVYLVIPFVKIFGLNVLSVRLPSVILSVLTVIAAYFLTKELFKNWDVKNSKILALLASLFLAVSPWHIYLSRLGHEANAGLAFFIFAMLFFLRRSIYLSFIFFSLSFASYQSEKIFIPIIFISLMVLFRKDLFAMKKKVIQAVIISLIILTPFIKETFSPNALIRFSAANIFNAEKQRFDKQAVFLAKAVEENNVIGRIIYNRRLLAVQIFSENYLSHFNPLWLFTNPSNDKHKVPGFGVLNIWEAPLILLSIIFLITWKLERRIKILVAIWIFASPIPGALTTDAPHAMRSYTMLPIPQILGALGIFQVVRKLSFWGGAKQRLQNPDSGQVLRSLREPEGSSEPRMARETQDRGTRMTKQMLIYFSMLLIIAGSLIYFYNQYFTVFPKTQSASFQYALSQMVPFVLNNEKQYNKVIISNKDNLYQSYMFFLFYSKYNPKIYQKQGGTKSGGFAEIHRFDKYEFRPINWQKENDQKSLYIGNINEFPKSTNYLILFSNLNRENVIEAVVK